MKINHTIVHYVIGGAALALAGTAMLKSPPVYETPALHQDARVSRHDWPALGQGKTIAIGEALKGTAPGKAMIFCAELTCRDFVLDLDDALQIADWTSAFEGRSVDDESGEGIAVGPPGPDAERLAALLQKETGMPVRVVAIDGLDGALGIIIGKSGH